MKQKKFIVFLIFSLLLLADIVIACILSLNAAYISRTGEFFVEFLNETEEQTLEAVIVTLLIASIIVVIIFITTESEIIDNITGIKVVNRDACKSGYRCGYLYFRKKKGKAQFDFLELLVAAALFASYRFEISVGFQNSNKGEINKNSNDRYISAKYNDFPEAEIEIIKQKREEVQ